MDFQELVVTRRTVHQYKTDKIDDEPVLKALELGLWAPNHKMTWPWRYYWLGPLARRKLADLAVELKSAKESEPMSEVKVAATRSNVLNPSHFILLGLAKTPEAHRHHENYATLACSVQIMSMYLWDQGIATKWSTGGFTTHAKTYEVIGASADEVQLEGGLMIGVPATMPAVPARPSLGEFLQRLE
ncbi:MAG: nitroreductase family protein [Bdellovibrionales bacterium]